MVLCGALGVEVVAVLRLAPARRGHGVVWGPGCRARRGHGVVWGPGGRGGGGAATGCLWPFGQAMRFGSLRQCPVCWVETCCVLNAGEALPISVPPPPLRAGRLSMIARRRAFPRIL
eukprot:366537-Chlamydomonas_euryale.AAC.6